MVKEKFDISMHCNLYIAFVHCVQQFFIAVIAYQAFLFQVVSINRAKRFLRDCGYRYASESLLQSELRVLKTLKFQVTEPTPIVYIETMLEILGNLSVLFIQIGFDLYIEIEWISKL